MPRSKAIHEEQIIFVDQEHPVRHLEQIEDNLRNEGNEPDNTDCWNERHREGCQLILLKGGMYTFFKRDVLYNWGKIHVKSVIFREK